MAHTSKPEAGPGFIPLFFRPDLLLRVVAAAAILAMLWLVSQWNYLLFHGIIELAGIAVAFSIFIIVWNSRNEIGDAFFLIAGFAFLFAGAINLFHALAYQGMGIFPGDSANLPTQLWIAGRYFMSIALFLATLFIGRTITRERKYDIAIIIAACTAASALIFASIFVWQDFPACYIEGAGLTLFKIASEYVICAILALTTIVLYLKRDHFDPAVWKLLVAAMLFLILGELSFSSYVNVYGFFNMIGHLCALVSVYLFYRVFVVVGLSRPYDLLLRDLRQREQSLRASEQRFRNLFDNLLEGFSYCRMIYDSEGRPIDWEYLAVNPAFVRLTGLENIAGKRVLEAIPGIREETPELFATYGRVARTGIAETFEIDFKPLKKWLRVSVFSPEKDYFVAVFDDITARKAAEDALRESEKRYRDMFEINNAVMFILDPATGAIVDANDAACRFYGYSREEITHLRITAINMAGPDQIRSDMARAAESSGAVFRFRHKKKNGEIREVRVFSAPIRLGGQLLLHSIIQDVTDQKMAEDALQETNRKLNLLSSITRHDIRNQLMALNAYIGLSEEAIDRPQDLREFLAKEQKIADSIARQITFTKDYENLGVQTPRWQNVDALVRAAGTALPLQNIQLGSRCAGLEVFADPLLEKVFYNLIDNSLRYGGTNLSAIRVSVLDGDGPLRIVYEDDGNGISTDDKRQLFRKGFGKHTGLGLFLSREILAITGIEIVENGEPGKGARFEMTVPVGRYRFT